MQELAAGLEQLKKRGKGVKAAADRARSAAFKEEGEEEEEEEAGMETELEKAGEVAATAAAKKSAPTTAATVAAAAPTAAAVGAAKAAAASAFVHIRHLEAELHEDASLLDPADDAGGRPLVLSKDALSSYRDGSQLYNATSPFPLFALRISDPSHLPPGAAAGPSAKATLLLHPASLLRPSMSPMPSSPEVASDFLRLFFPPSTPGTTLTELHSHVTDPGRRYAFCITLHHRGRAVPRGSPAEVQCAEAGVFAASAGGGGGGTVPPPHVRSSAEMRRAVVRVEAVYELDEEGGSV